MTNEREIKFRAWDKESKRMFNIVRFDFADHTVYSHLFACEGYLAENLKIMQYTGLKDVNGSEIYEGDVLTCEGYWGYYVSFKEGCFALEYLDTITRAIHYARVTPINHIRATEWEVIGNIYEHPHLMELDRK